MSRATQLEDMDGLIEELTLGSARGGKRQAKAPVTVDIIRELTPGDLPALQAPPPVGSVPSIPEIRHQHHQLAGLLARGVPNAEISLILGFSPSYISTLRNAPDMQELIAYYAARAEERTIDALARLRNLGLTGVEELQQRIDADPKSFTTGQLMDLVEVGLLKPAQIGAIAASGKSAAGGGVQINLNFKAPEGGGSGGSPVIEAQVAGRSGGADD